MKKVLAVIVLLLMPAAFVFSQRADAGLYGKVLRPDGAPVRGVRVILTGDVIGKMSVRTTKVGNFRFLWLPPGTYQLKLEKGGCKTVIYKKIRMVVGIDKKLKITMRAGPAAPPEIIEDKSGIFDKPGSTNAANITKEKLRSLPTARNPWTVINLVPGILIDRQDVGGNESGQHSSLYGLGAGWNDTTWYIDGVNITHPASLGIAPTYVDTNSFAEVQVTLTGSDVTARTGGVQLNFVTGRGGNRFSGGLHFYLEDEVFEMKQDLPASITGQGFGSPGIIKLYQYGVNLAGPVSRDKLWFSGSYAIQDIHARTIRQNENTTRIGSLYGKLDFLFGRTSGSLFYTQNNREKLAMTWLDGPFQDPSTCWDLTEPHDLYMATIRQVLGGLTVNAKAAYTSAAFTLDPEGSNINPASGHLEGEDWLYYPGGDVDKKEWTGYYPWAGYFSGSLPYHSKNREALNFSLDGSYFLEKFRRGDHEIRFGADYYIADTTSQTLYPNQRRLFIYDRNNPGGYKEIWWVSDGIFKAGFDRLSFYLSDTFTFGRLTADIGLRYDREKSFMDEAETPALTLKGVPIFTSFMGDLAVGSWKEDIAFPFFSPRISLTYDIKGNGRHVLRASYARYGSFIGDSTARLRWMFYPNLGATACREIDVYWDDKNGDLKPQLNEFSQHYQDFLWYNINPNDPYAMFMGSRIAPGYKPPILDEIVFSFEKVLGQNVVVALNAFYKKETNLTWNRSMFAYDMVPIQGAPIYKSGEPETADNWYKTGTWTFENGDTKDIYERYYVPNQVYRTNHGSGTFNTYKALQLVLSKRLSRGWLLDASFTLSDWKRHLDSEEFFDPTNFAYFDGGAVAPESGAYDFYDFNFYYNAAPAPQTFGSRLAGIYVNSRWQLKAAGLVQLPYGFSLSGLFYAREGYIVAYHELMKRGSGLGWTPLYEPGKKFGDDRLPAFWMVNLGVEKTFNFSSFATATLFINGYNITNNSTTLQVNSRLNSPGRGQAQRILNPGIFQFGMRINF